MSDMDRGICWRDQGLNHCNFLICNFRCRPAGAGVKWLHISKEWFTAGARVQWLHISNNGLQLEKGVEGTHFKRLVYNCSRYVDITHFKRLDCSCIRDAEFTCSKEWSTAGVGIPRSHVQRTKLQLDMGCRTATFQKAVLQLERYVKVTHLKDWSTTGPRMLMLHISKYKSIDGAGMSRLHILVYSRTKDVDVTHSKDWSTARYKM